MTRRILFTLSAFCLVLANATSFAQTSVFPWEGEISGNNVNVRSGEGTRYYATCKLANGDRVLVLGESNGWYKILPPPSSFSYIDKNAVERHTNDIGSVSRDKAYVRAGSHISRRKSRTQVILGMGDPVVILGEVDGFYKIEPPKRAVLFVSREFVTPVPADRESGLVSRYSAADWTKAGSAEADADAAATPDLPDDAEPVAVNSNATPTSGSPTITNSNTMIVNSTEPHQPVIRTTNRIGAEPTKTTTPPIRANRPIDTPANRPEPRNSTLVLSPTNATAPTPRYDSNPNAIADRSSESQTTGAIYTNEPPQYETTSDDAYGVSQDRPELVPAERRPPAQVPDWARDNDRSGTTPNRIASRDESTYSGGSNVNSGGSVQPYGSQPRVATAQPSSSSRMGTMVEITPGTSNRPASTTWNEPASTASNAYTPPPASTTGTGIVAYERPTQSDTLTLNASNSNYSNGMNPARAPANAPIASNTPVSTNTRHMPITIVDPRNSHPAGPTNGGYVEPANSYSTTASTSDTYYINSGNSPDDNAYASNDSADFAPPADQTDIAYATPSSPPPEVPIDPNTGPYAAKLVALEGELHGVMERPVQQRPYEQLIARYEEIAVQSSERVPSEYAAIRIDQLKALERVRRLAVRYASDHEGIQHFSRRMDEERAEIRSAQRNVVTTESGAFEYEGQLMKSYAFSPEKRRYRLVDPGTQSTIIYVDIPVSVEANPDTLTGKRVGIRIGRREYSEAAQIPIVEAASIVDLTSPPTKYQPIPAPQVRNSGDFSNPANTGGDHPNPLMNEPVARERRDPATMGEMVQIES
ncbi:MAG: hypothetical protein H6818_22670 [Phycisphaerales bacterium]|nr:hypothetical protein [Phycisphaerales bacterium]